MMVDPHLDSLHSCVIFSHTMKIKTYPRGWHVPIVRKTEEPLASLADDISNVFTLPQRGARLYSLREVWDTSTSSAGACKCNAKRRCTMKIKTYPRGWHVPIVRKTEEPLASLADDIS
ncbi:MAG: hypothetical protein O7C59_07695, partial [Rickettsia endosymbiont of Ixodes persulcatus]|nr:hypothetical protein [Rickettsia endosymbiont of Ixodes persulcatus]